MKAEKSELRLNEDFESVNCAWNLQLTSIIAYFDNDGNRGRKIIKLRLLTKIKYTS